jgi:hypothetical protein
MHSHFSACFQVRNRKKVLRINQWREYDLFTEAKEPVTEAFPQM